MEIEKVKFCTRKPCPMLNEGKICLPKENWFMYFTIFQKWKEDKGQSSNRQGNALRGLTFSITHVDVINFVSKLLGKSITLN